MEYKLQLFAHRCDK